MLAATVIRQTEGEQRKLRQRIEDNRRTCREQYKTMQRASISNSKREKTLTDKSSVPANHETKNILKAALEEEQKLASQVQTGIPAYRFLVMWKCMAMFAMNK